MDSFFTYEKPVSGKSFIGRTIECRAVCNLLGSSQHVVLYAPPKSGKASLLQQSLLTMKLDHKQFSVCNINALGVQSLEHFLLRFGNTLIRSCCSTPAEYSQTVAELLPDTHFVFDKMRFADVGEVLSANWTLDENDAVQLFRMPFRLAERRSERLITIIDEFQDIAETDQAAAVFRSFKKVILEERNSQSPCSFVFCGSRYNAMREIFARSPMFRGLVSRVTLGRIEEMPIADHIKRGVNISGKVIEKKAVFDIIRRFDNNMWYINHFMAICDSKTKGYFNDNVFNDGMRCLISVHEPFYLNIMANLTGHQISFLKAVLDGVTRFTASEIIRAYALNSSANVSRVKEALMKKEIITFNEHDEAVFLDILFKYWLETKYFTL